MNVKPSALACIGLIAIGAGRASATTFTETVNFPGPGSTVNPTDFVNAKGTTANVTNPGTLYYFDTNGGALSSITFTYDYTFLSQIAVSSTTPSSGTVRTESGAQFGTTDSTKVTAALNRIINTDTNGLSFGQQTLAPVAADVFGSTSSYNFTASSGGSTNFISQGRFVNSFTDTTAADLAAFSQAGGGVFTPMLNTLTGLVSTSSGGNAQLTHSTRGEGTLTIAYNYDLTPPTAVPEPGSMALLGAGLVGVGVFRRRRQG